MGVFGPSVPDRDSTALPRRVLGRTGVRVPVLGFGTAACGIRRDIPNGVALYHRALELGVNYFDTAPSDAGYGRAQRQLAAALKGRRAKAFLATKCHASGYDETLRLLDANLKELGTDHADLVYVHSLGDLDVERVAGRRGALRALLRAKEEGRTRFVGVSGHSRVGKFVRLLRSDVADEIDVLMVAVNFADRHTYDFEGRVFPLAARRGIGLAAMKVFGGADFDSGAMSNAMMPGEHHESALRYALSLPNVSLAVVGMATQAELEQNVARAKAYRPLSATERKAIEAPGRRLARRWGAHYGPAA